MSFLTKSQILLSIDICIVCSWSLSKNKNKIKFYLKIEYLLYKSASTDRNMYEFQSKSKKYGVNIYNDLLIQWGNPNVKELVKIEYLISYTILERPHKFYLWF
jgi:hypothetical protein